MHLKESTSAAYMSRRDAMFRTCGGLSGLALTWLLQQNASGATVDARPRDLSARQPTQIPQAENVILLFMGGGPSQVDLLDPKPAIEKYDGQDIPMSIFQRGLSAGKKLMASPYRFTAHGQSGIEVSELLPHFGRVVDEVTVIRSATTNRIDHDNAQFMFNSGRPVPGFPSMGSWICYALGTVNQNLPAYVALASGLPNCKQRIYSSGWLPPLYQGTQMKVEGIPVYDLERPAAMTSARQRKLLDFLRGINRHHQQQFPDQAEFEARIANFELAARMQSEVMNQIDLAREPEYVKEMYGIDQPHCGKYARYCLVARKLVESGVRFVHVLRGDWDHHSNLTSRLSKSCAETDQPVAALVTDLKQRGLLDKTLVIWAGEFGRLPITEGNNGRDHSPHGFSLWMAGGGIRGGSVFGATDEFGYAAVEDKITPSDVHATVLKLLGLDYKTLTYPFEGRDESLVGVNKARVLDEIIF